MKARYERTFERGKDISKTTLFAAVLCSLAGVLLCPTGSVAQVVCIVASFALLIATFAVMYKLCRCPYCGKRISMGVLSVKSCPGCHRNLETGKKMKKK